MKYYVAMMFFALQLTLTQVEAVNIGTDPVGNARIKNGEEEAEGAREAHKPSERKI